MSIGRWLARHGLVLLAIVGFIAFDLAALFALPLAVLLATSPLRTAKETLVAAVAGGMSLAWLIEAGELPDQVMRAGIVLATAGFVLTTRYSAATFTNSALVSVGLAALATGGLLLALGSSWGELRWWVAHETGRVLREISQLLWMAEQGGASGSGNLAALLGDTVRYTANYFPAAVALQLIAGLALATAIYRRVASAPHGAKLGRFTSFRFSEQLGWVVIPPLLVTLIPFLSAAKLGATNLLIVMGALYAIRGAAVVAFGLQLIGASSPFIAVFVILAAFLILPIAVAGAILLGVVDSGLDLRRRWKSPQAS
jgi:hypothetical protein